MPARKASRHDPDWRFGPSNGRTDAPMDIESLRSAASSLPPLTKFAIGMGIILVVPPLARRVRLPPVVGLLLSGVVAGPHGLGLFGENRPVVEFLADLGKLLLMLFAGLELDLALFRRQRNRSIAFGLVTTIVPLLLGTVAGLVLGYGTIPAIVVGSLLASHTLLALPIIDQLGLRRLEPVTVTVGATGLSDTLSLVVFAICIPAYEGDLSLLALLVQIVEIVAFVPLILFGLSRIASYALERVREEDAQFVLILGMMAVTGVLARLINLPGIVGAFLAGLAINESVRDKAATEKLAFVGKSFFIPIFFVAIGFLIDPLDFARSLVENFSVVSAILIALIAGKWIAAEAAGRAFGYSTVARSTMWSLTLPQVAATLAATLVAFRTVDPAGRHLLDTRMLNAVLVMVLTTSILGPLLTQHFGVRLRAEASGTD
jgi:Kef-type K+ transport system membrane component KefB